MSSERGSRNLESRVLEALAASRRGPLKPKEVARALDVPAAKYRRLKRTLAGLVRAGKAYRVKGNRYGLPGAMDLVVGSAAITRSGDAFVRPDAGSGDVFVPGVDLASALDGDRVVVRIEARPRSRSPVGRVIRVLERARSTVVGTFHEARRLSYVVPLDRGVARDLLIPPGDGGGAEDGDVVVARYTSYGEGGRGPVGEVERVLGKLSDPGVDVLAIAHGYGLVLDFPPDVLAAADAVASERREEPGPGRVDRTDLHVVTIDPADAQDHDDALHARPLDDGAVEVGVHIADVAHFVEEGCAIDREAEARGTSVYLVDRTIPMLPERLSGDVCSLREGVDRFAVSVVVELDAAGRVRASRFERTVIRSRRRLSYEIAQAVLDGRRTVDPETDAALRHLDDVARRFRERRHERGALDLDLPEARVVLDTDGTPLDIRKVERLESHRLVEDLMILANEIVARACEARAMPALFRVHEPPARERAEELAEFLRRWGLELPRRKSLRPRDLQALLASVTGRPEEALVSTVVLRSLKRARYAPDNLGHFGLASDAYLHFTSPIRRYPDLVVHREVCRTLVDGGPVRVREADELASVAERASARERAAEDAERDSVALKKVEFMERHLGDEFEGRVSGVQAFGFFVTLDAVFVDGLVHVNALHDDFYRLRDGAYELVGDRGRRRFRLGDRVLVQVARVDREARHIDFLLVRQLPRNV